MNTEPHLQKTSGLRPDTRMDALVIGCLLGVCLLGILLLSPRSAHVPAVTAGDIETTVSASPGFIDPGLGQASKESRMLVPPQKIVNIGPAFEPNTPLSRQPTRRSAERKMPTAPGFITLLGDTHNDAFFLRSNQQNLTGFWGGDWSEKNVENTAEGASLTLRRERNARTPYSMAELKSRAHYGYGRYEVVMRPARGGGIVSSFFTYTGPYEGRPHDEVDIEFLGMDTSRIHFNYYKNGTRGEPATFDLPFDAADANNLYAFEWRPDGITWFVNGTPYYSTEEGDRLVPTSPSKVMLNIWTGIPKMQSWHGKPTFDEARAHYACVSFTPLGEDTRACSDLYLPDRPFKGRGLTASDLAVPSR